MTLAMTGKPKDAIPTLTSGIAAWRATGATIALPLMVSDLAHAHAQIGEFDEAWQLVDEAMAIVDGANENAYKVFALLKGGEIELLSTEPDVAKAEALFQRALAASREQEAKGWELRAAMSLARLWRDQGKTRKAYKLLSPVYNWFTEGFDWTYMKQAKALLEELK
jgi:predicted ATPase